MTKRKLYCSFCGKAREEVFVLIVGIHAHICDECINSAQQVVTDRKIEAGCTAVVGKLPTRVEHREIKGKSES